MVSLLLPCSSAFRASLRLVLETLFLVESLFAFRKDELVVAVLAGQCLVCHYIHLLNLFGLNDFLDTTLQLS